MRDETIRIVGNIAICWNKADEHVERLCTLYLNLDTIAVDFLVKPMRATDKENLLRKVVGYKESDPEIKAEVLEAIKRTAVCRENRNIVLHQIGSLDGEIDPKADDILLQVLADLTATCDYLGLVYEAVRKVMQDRDAREVPNFEGKSGDDELIPLAVFEKPQRPPKPHKLDIGEMIVADAKSSVEQITKFKQAAREIGADESDDALDRVMGKLDLKRKPEAEKPTKE